MSNSWDDDLERASLRLPGDFHEFEKNRYTHRVDSAAAVEILLSFDQDLATRSSPVTITRHEIARLASAAFVAGKYWHDIQDMVEDLDSGHIEIGDLEDAADSVRRAATAEEDAFLENKETRAILADMILRIIEDPTNEEARQIAMAMTITALRQYDIREILDQPITEEYFWQLVAGAHRPDSRNYNPTPETRVYDRTTSSAYVALVGLAKVVGDIDFKSIASPTGEVELTSDQLGDLGYHIRTVAHFVDRMRDMAYDVGISYTLFGMAIEESYEEAQQALADAHDAEIDYRIALIAAAQILANSTTDPKIHALARQLAQAELDNAATTWELKPKKHKQKLVAESY